MDSPSNCCQECLDWRQEYQKLEHINAHLQDHLNQANERIAQAGSLGISMREELWECCSSIHEMAIENESGAHKSFTVLLEPAPGGTGRVVELSSFRDYAYKKEEMYRLQTELGSLKATLQVAAVNFVDSNEDHLKELKALQEAAARMIEEARDHSEQVAALRAEVAASGEQEKRLRMEVARLQEELRSSGQVPTPQSHRPLPSPRHLRY